MKKHNNDRAGLLRTLSVVAAVAILSGVNAKADVLNPIISATPIYEENFNGASLDSTLWNVIDGDGCGQGLCGWGNGELENYDAKNVSIDDVPFEPGTRALALTARSEAKGKSLFTSGKITSFDKLQIKYGLIELRISTPQVGIGLWPAAWMLGTSIASWPKKGELDIMEMGHSAGGMYFQGSDVNSYTASNSIYYSSSACVPGNASCAASTAWKTANAYVASTPLTNRFVIYRMYWTDTQIRYTVTDNGVEHDMYAAPFNITADSAAFQAPFYLLFNLAVGGNFTDAKTAAQVTAPLPGKMYVDYVKVYKLDGLGEVKLGRQVRKETGNFGVFTDNTPTTNKLVIGSNADFWIWENTFGAGATVPAYEGSGVLSLRYDLSKTWFGAGFAAREVHDMSLFAGGNVKFRIKVPADVAFKIGVGDTYSNTNYVNFPANQAAYGLVRTGDWAQATIPVAELRGTKIALQSLNSMFNIVNNGKPASAFDLAIDDIVWECGTSPECNPVSSSSSSSSSFSSSSLAPSSSSIASSSLSSTSVTSSSVRSSSSFSSNSSVPAPVSSYTILSSTSVKFLVTNAAWVDIHYSINGAAQRNVRMTHNADNSNSYTLVNAPAGASVKYSFTISGGRGIAVQTLNL
jgi:beta-glucanase (GH16 family)